MVGLVLEILEIVIQLPSWLLPLLAIVSTQKEKKWRTVSGSRKMEKNAKIYRFFK